MRKASGFQIFGCAVIWGNTGADSEGDLISASLEFSAIWAQSGLPGTGRIGSNDAHEAVVLRIHGLSSRRQVGPSSKKPVRKI